MTEASNTVKKNFPKVNVTVAVLSYTSPPNSKNSVETAKDRSWIRGVNLGGWLVLERYITPYQFAITDCHLAGKFCWYPGALSAPPGIEDDNAINTNLLCDLEICHPARRKTLGDAFDYPIDEWTLASAFQNKTIGEEWLNYHFDNFITKDDLIEANTSGVTHVRVPLPHWILGNVQQGEPWIPGNRWKRFLDLCDWARDLAIQVWPNLHTAPGSQNGFDNSGVESSTFTCLEWGDNANNVQRTLDIIHEITYRISQDGLLDVVTGFGLLNEPFGDCSDSEYRTFLHDGLTIARSNMGAETNIFVSDKFFAPNFNNGRWWLDPIRFQNTYLDTHFYHVFSPEVRAFGPVDHLELVCHPDDAQLSIESCCYEDAPHSNSTPSQGVRRISSEWSAAYDCHPGELLSVVMEGIALNGIAPDFHRIMEPDRKEFLKTFASAQMIAYEAADTGLSDGWFYWTLKMEGGAFAEWDFSRGQREGFLPTLVNPSQPSADVYGTCDDLIDRTNNDTSIVHPYPWGDEEYWRDSVPYQPPKHLPPHNWHPGDAPVSSMSERVTSLPIRPSHIGILYFLHNVLALIGLLTVLHWCAKCLVEKLLARQRKDSGYETVTNEYSPLLSKTLPLCDSSTDPKQDMA